MPAVLSWVAKCAVLAVLVDAVTAASHVDMARRSRIAQEAKQGAALAPLAATTNAVVAIGASTGGTVALEAMMRVLPANSPGMVISQHIPEFMSKVFADRLNEIAAVEVREARHGDSVSPGVALIAPGNRHLLLGRSGARYIVRVKDGPRVNRHRPSVDVMFRSVAEHAGPNAVGVILTGMGGDGAQGLLEMKKAGARTIAQDEQSCVVFGMPKVAIGLGAADEVLPLKDIPFRMLQLAQRTAFVTQATKESEDVRDGEYV